MAAPRKAAPKAVAKKAVAKKAVAKKAVAKKAVAKKAVEKATAGLADVPQLPATDRLRLEEARAQRKRERRGRAALRQGFRAERTGEVDPQALHAAVERFAARAAPGPATTRRWVPLGPSVVRQGQALGRPRVAGRIRQVEVDSTGRRAYAVAANGGVWYTDDGARSWSPVGPWAERSRRQGGRANAMSGGSLLVAFDNGGDVSKDVVVVGTGEPPVTLGLTLRPDAPTAGGLGVLASVGPLDPGRAGNDPWEAESGIALLEGGFIYRLARQPGRTAGAVAPNPDRLVACTGAGAFLGTRATVGGVNQYTWTQMALAFTGAPPLGWPANPVVTDASWLPGGAHGRLVLAVWGWGLVTSDDAGATISQVPTLDNTAVPRLIRGRITLARAGTTNRGYALLDDHGAPTLWRLPDLTLSPPVATQVNGVPAGLWGTQRDYDQALAVDVVTVTNAADDVDGGGDNRFDRVYLGGSVVLQSNEYVASLWCMDVDATPALVPAKGVSRAGAPTAAPGGGDGADVAGLIGNNVHGDMHWITVAGAAPARQVWVTCDGGIFRSDRSGQVNTFVSVGSGLTTLEPGYLALHATSDQFLAAGFQDNGTAVRTGDTVWEEVFEADGGGVAFHPVATDVLLAQYTQAAWQCGHPQYLDPIHRLAVHPNWGTIAAERENGVAAFYAGASSVRNGAAGRIAVGTDRVWLSDDIGGAAACTWRVLPFPGPGPAVDQRAAAIGGATDNVAPAPTTGVPRAGRPVAAFGAVTTLRWASGTQLIAAFGGGVVRWTERAPNSWLGRPFALTAASVLIERNQTITDVAPVPGTQDFYVTTLGVGGTDQETVWFWDDAGQAFHRTRFRLQLPPVAPNPFGPLDPAYAVVVDPVDTTQVYVGTATGVWHGTRRDANGRHDWELFTNGLPEAAVQDLAIWVDRSVTPPPATSPRLLRAGVQARGLWEVDLAHDAVRETWVRVHAHDARRMPTTALPDPRRPVGTVLTADASPDVVVRPRWPAASQPPFIGPAAMTELSSTPFEVWTFQTAFRFLYPSVLPTGVFDDAFGDLVELHRTTVAGMAPGRMIDKQLWNAVVGGVRLSAGLTASTVAADKLAVYRAPWHTPAAPNATATEIDLMECVLPASPIGPWGVYGEPLTVDVLLHHRDSRPALAGRAWAMLLWRRANSLADAVASPVAGVRQFRVDASGGAPNIAAPPGWSVVRDSGGVSRFTLPADLSARQPRAVSIDLDLTPPVGPVQPFVALLALVGSLDDDVPDPAPAAAPATASALALGWSRAALRVLQVVPRPAPAP